MAEDQPIHFSEFTRARTIDHLIRVNSTANLLAEIQFPLTPDNANKLLSTQTLTLQEYRALLSKTPDPADRELRSALSKIQHWRNAHLGFMREFGAALLDQNRPEAVPILLATDTFLDEDIQELIEDKNLLRNEALDTLTRAYDLMDYGGAIIFPSFSEEYDSIAVIHSPDRVPFFRKYIGHVLDNQVLSRKTPAAMSAEMIRPRKRS